jgi:hypothetical protein
MISLREINRRMHSFLSVYYGNENSASISMRSFVLEWTSLRPKSRKPLTAEEYVKTYMAFLGSATDY